MEHACLAQDLQAAWEATEAWQKRWAEREERSRKLSPHTSHRKAPPPAVQRASLIKKNSKLYRDGLKSWSQVGRIFLFRKLRQIR